MVPIAEALRGANLAYENAHRLFISSAHLNREGLAGPAAALCVLAFEEAAKAISLVYRSQGIRDGDWLKTYFRSHKAKHDLGANTTSFHASLLSKIGFEVKVNDSVINATDMPARIEVWRQQADEIKKRGFYVDFEAGSWVTPDQITEELFETGVVACGIAISTARSFIVSAS